MRGARLGIAGFSPLHGAEIPDDEGLLEVSTRLKDWGESVKLRVEEQIFLKGLGQQVRILRQERSITQAELAEQAGIGAKYVGEIERGRTNPTMRLVWRLGGALDVEVFELFLFSPAGGDQEGMLRTRLMQFLKDYRGKELQRAAEIFKWLSSLEPQ